MDQVDKIIFQNFHLLGWENENEVSNLEDLDISEVAKLMIKCLHVINSDCDLPHSFPHNMSQRFRIAAKIAEEIKALGYVGDLGYQSILYSNLSDLRKIFTFLIEKLPKDDPKLSKEPVGRSYLIQREAQRKINEAIQCPWFPPHCMAVSRRYKMASSEDVSITGIAVQQSCPFTSSYALGRDINRLYSKSLSDCIDNTNNSDYKVKFSSHPQNTLVTTLMNAHAEDIGRNLSNFDSDEEDLESDELFGIESKDFSINKYLGLKLSDIPDVFMESSPGSETFADVASSLIENDEKSKLEEPVKTEGDKCETTEKELEQTLSNLSLEISQLETDIATTTKEVGRTQTSIISLEETLQESAVMFSEEEKKLTVLLKTSSLVADPQTAIMKLKASLQSSREKEERHLKQWDDYRAPLDRELEEAQLALEKRQSKRKEIQDEMIEAKRTTKSLIEDAKRKEILLSQLQEQKQRLQKGVNRSVYTKQILDICDKVQKQKKETQNVLDETRRIQKEINNLTGKLQRTFAVAEDSCFKVASANDRARPIYRAVVSIHEECGHIVDVIRDSGSIQRENAELKQQFKSEKSKNIEENLKKLQEDFRKLKQENLSLKQKLPSKS